MQTLHNIHNTFALLSFPFFNEEKKKEDTTVWHELSTITWYDLPRNIFLAWHKYFSLYIFQIRPIREPSHAIRMAIFQR